MPNTEVKPEDKKVETPPADDLQAPEELDENPPVLESDDESPAPSQRVHPLLPGGRRFEQVYAKGKQAEREAQELREQLAAANAKLEILSGKEKQTAEVEYTWAQLEEFIARGQITRADAEAHREEVIARRLSKQIKGDFTNETRQATREQTLTQVLQDYVAAVPAITDETSPDRARLDEEFDFLASIQGLDPSKVEGAQRKALQITALRNVYGPIDSLRKRSVAPKVESSEGLSGGTPPRSPNTNKDQEILNKLTKAQVTHYKKMMAAGRYKGGWKDVVAELKYVPPKRGGR